MGFSELDYQAMLLRTTKARRIELVSPSSSAGVDRESDLHDDIESYCRSKGWYYVHSRMDRKSTVGIGCTDFAIAMEDGKTLWVEAKGKLTKVSVPQQGVILMLQKLGHNAGIVRSMEEFLKMISEAK